MNHTYAWRWDNGRLIGCRFKWKGCHSMTSQQMPGTTSIHVLQNMHFIRWKLMQHNYYPGQKKKNHPRDSRREERCSTCDIMLDQVRSAQGQKSRTAADRTCPALISPDRAWYHTWNSVLLAANLDDGSFFVQGSMLATSRWCFFFCPG